VNITEKLNVGIYWRDVLTLLRTGHMQDSHEMIKIGPGEVSLEGLKGEIERASGRLKRTDQDSRLVLEVHPWASICVPEVCDEDVVVPEDEGIIRSTQAVKYYAKEMRREALRREVAAFFTAFSDAGLFPTHLVFSDNASGPDVEADDCGRAFVVHDIVRWARFEPSSERSAFVADADDEGTLASAAAFRKFGALIRSIDRLDELVNPKEALSVLFENVPALEDLTVDAVIVRWTGDGSGISPVPGKRLKTLTVLCREHSVSAKELTELLAPSAERIRLGRDLFFDDRDTPVSAIEAALADLRSTLEFCGPSIILNTGARPQFTVPRLGPDVSELTVWVMTAEGLGEAVAAVPATVTLFKLVDATGWGISGAPGGSGVVRDCVSAFLRSPPERAGAVLDVSELLQEGDAPQDVLDFAAALGVPGVSVKVAMEACADYDDEEDDDDEDLDVLVGGRACKRVKQDIYTRRKILWDTPT
jgi:hypothetical protein